MHFVSNSALNRFFWDFSHVESVVASDVLDVVVRPSRVFGVHSERPLSFTTRSVDNDTERRAVSLQPVRQSQSCIHQSSTCLRRQHMYNKIK